jgi:hypothetical protein
MARKIKIPAEMPANAAGFIAIRPDLGRDERRALYASDGQLQASFAWGATDAEIAAILAPAGFRVTGQFVFHA